jgi:hypothetical protein
MIMSRNRLPPVWMQLLVALALTAAIITILLGVTGGGLK